LKKKSKTLENDTCGKSKLLLDFFVYSFRENSYYVEAGGRVSASTQFGDFSGAVGLVALIIGIVLMAISALA